jgi:tetratricopeptide (TPR) repeat protein
MLDFEPTMRRVSNVELVKGFLKAQNFEQVGRIEEAIVLYEAAIEQAFDASGPYDRLIALYSHRAQHADVVRIAERAIENVHTYEDKIAWYEQMRAAAIKARTKVPKATPKGVGGEASDGGSD